MKRILVCFGGISPEHEVSIITGLQVLEQIDRSAYQVDAIYVSQDGISYLLPQLVNRSEFLNGKKTEILYGRDDKGGYIQTKGMLSQKIYPDCAYFAFHGGSGESGPIQGIFESLGIPHTGPFLESASLSMNKALTKTVASSIGIKVIPGVSILSSEVKENSSKVAKDILKKVKVPLIVKPAHLGSSIGVTVCKTEVALTKALLEASRIDSEIVVESLISKFTEYNCAVRLVDGKLEVSEIEHPLKKDEILSFADKYQRGGKKTGGMASLSRDLPAKIDKQLRNKIEQNAKDVYLAVRAKGMIRCDFMLIGKDIHLIEVNPIPGSMSFYLWEASGISFEQQITDSIEESIKNWEEKQSKKLNYQTDIVEKFVSNINQ